MKHLSEITAGMLKKSLSPDQYYRAHLEGDFGKPTGHDWHAWNGLCPFHNDTQPGSFVVNQKTGAFKCFSCGESGGDIIDFHMKVNRLGFKEAFKDLVGGMSCAKS